jgi:hypothetical protein
VGLRADFQGGNVKALLRILLGSLNVKWSMLGSAIGAMGNAVFWGADILAVYPLVEVRALLMRNGLPTSPLDVCRPGDRSAARHVLLKWTT